MFGAIERNIVSQNDATTLGLKMDSHRVFGAAEGAWRKESWL